MDKVIRILEKELQELKNIFSIANAACQSGIKLDPEKTLDFLEDIETRAKTLRAKIWERITKKVANEQTP